MSGFAVMFDSQAPIGPQDRNFVTFKESVADYKQLNSGGCEVSGRQCAAAKFDTPSTLHRGVLVDKESGSWLLAAGTVLDSENNPDDGGLQTLLANYLSQGNAALQNVDGPFALVIYDRRADRLVVVSDPMGFVSVFLARRGSRIYVATSALAVAKAVQATPSEYGTYLFLTTGNVYGRSTLWQEVERLSAGTVMEITQAGTTQSVYWSPVIDNEISSLSLTEAVEYFFDLLSRLLKHHLKREGKVWVDLTGGFDSRLVAMMMHHCGLPFEACCEGPTGSSDVSISSRITKELGWDYRHNMLAEDWGEKRCELLFSALGRADGHLDLFKATSVLWDQDQRALRHGTSIWGLGGELWRGYTWRLEFLNLGRSPTVNFDRLVDYRFMHPMEQTIFSDVGRVKWIREELKSLLKSVGDCYADLPNTVKLDYIFAHTLAGLAGAHVSAVMGKQRVLSPLCFKGSVSGAISTHYKWRSHSRLVRLLMEKINPVLASFETTDGGPALPMRISNWYKFVPCWFLIGKKALRKTSKVALGRNLLPETHNKPTVYPLSYPVTQWRQQTLDYLEQDNVLNHSHMRSGRFYNAERLADFLKQARTEVFSQEVILSRVLTVEMALRTVGASF